MYWSSTPRPAVIVAVGVLLVAAGCVGLVLIWGDGAAAVEYQWGLAGYREAPAKVVQTITTHPRRSGPVREVVLTADGSTQTIHVHNGDLYSKLAPGVPVRERLVDGRVVAIRVGAEELPIEDNFQWLIGLPAGILLGVMLLFMGIRAGLAKGFFASGGTGSYQGSMRASPETAMAIAGAVLLFSAFSLGAIEGLTNGLPPLPVVAVVILAFAVVGGVLLTRTAGVNRALNVVASQVASDELITALIVRAKNGQWDVSFIGDGRVPKDLTVSALDEAALSQIETLIADTHTSRPVDVSFAWYPWESKGGRAVEFMIFMTQHLHGDYVATLDGRPEITASSSTFEGLSTAIEKVMAGQGDADPQHLQACITWNRTLTTWGYVPLVPSH